MAELPEQQTDIEELFPADPEAELAPDEELEISETSLDDEAEDDVEVILPDPPPLGRAWAYDFPSNQMYRAGRSAMTVRGDANLIQWIEKCLRTEAGASVVHPPGYGLEMALSEYLGAGLADTGNLTRAIKEAITFHPSIKDVEDIEVVEGETTTGEAAISIAFRVVLGDSSDLEFETQISTGEIELG